MDEPWPGCQLWALRRSTGLVAVCKQENMQGHRSRCPAADVGEQATCHSGALLVMAIFTGVPGASPRRSRVHHQQQGAILMMAISEGCLAPPPEGQDYITNRKADEPGWLHKAAQAQLAWPMPLLLARPVSHQNCCCLQGPW